jgi:hypothetical protein
MSNGKPKVEIPAWQRAPLPKTSSAENTVSSDAANEDSATPEQTSEKLEQPPSSNEESAPDRTIVEKPEKEGNGFAAQDFNNFTQQQHTQRSVAPPARAIQPTAPPAPPIITYPEFLLDAHKPPPFITPSRVLNTVYAAGGISAILYAASKWVITPMVEDLSEARHELLHHSQSKVDEFNERLSKIVSKMPGSKNGTTDPDDDEDAGSETSDPTELYHRDFGTQTDPPPSPKTMFTAESEKKDAVDRAVNGLRILKEHMTEITEGSERAGESHQGRMEKMSTLRHYLDTLIYGTAGAGTWSEEAMKQAYGTGTVSNNGPAPDAFEELKKEIRGVKGVLLSAKRFPAASRPVSAAA